MACESMGAEKPISAAVPPRVLLFRADASAEIGIGHVYRCLALAQAWQDQGGVAVFLSRDLPTPLGQRLEREGILVRQLQAEIGTGEDARETIVQAQQAGASWVVLDGYRFDATFQQAVNHAEIRTLLIDDEGTLGPYEVTAILNQNPSARPEWYIQKDASPLLLLGTRYALLRREFRRHTRVRSPETGPARVLVVSFGGADPARLTEKVIEAIPHLRESGLTIQIIVGGANLRSREIARQVTLLGPMASFCPAVDDMGAIWSKADLAVIAAGSTCWEICHAGVPGIVIAAAPNQLPLASQMESLGAATNLGWHRDVGVDQIIAAIRSLASDAERRASMIQSAQRVVDGHGAPRVAEILAANIRHNPCDERLEDESRSRIGRSGRPSTEIRLRPARMSDAQQLLDWRNDPTTRSASHQQTPISLVEHLKWLESTLKNPDRSLYIAEVGPESVGTVRLDRDLGVTEISWTVAPGARGRGIGLGMVRQALGGLRGPARAEIKAGNHPSIRIAERAGMRLQNREGEVIHYVYNSDLTE